MNMFARFGEIAAVSGNEWQTDGWTDTWMHERTHALST